MKRRWLEAAAVDLTLVLILAVLGNVCLKSRQSTGAFAADKAIYRAETQEKKLALMMNVYEGEDLIPDILAVLESENVRATFFIGGLFAEKHAGAVRLIAEAGHEIGNHGYHHKLHTRLSREKSREEITKTNELLKSITGKAVTLFAPPSGDVNDEVIADARACGCRTVMWSADTIDWRDQDEEKILARVERNIAPGVLILTHPTEATLRVLPRMLASTREKGYEFETVGALIGA